MPVLPCPDSDGRGAHGVGWPAVSPPWGLSIIEAAMIASIAFAIKVTDHATQTSIPVDEKGLLATKQFWVDCRTNEFGHQDGHFSS